MSKWWAYFSVCHHSYILISITTGISCTLSSYHVSTGLECPLQLSRSGPCTNYLLQIKGRIIFDWTIQCYCPMEPSSYRTQLKVATIELFPILHSSSIFRGYYLVISLYFCYHYVQRCGDHEYEIMKLWHTSWVGWPTLKITSRTLVNPKK
jgi:hypothetical protein